MNTALVHVLIAEDDAAHVEAIRRAFETAGTKVDCRAVATLREYRACIAEWTPDLALVDLNLSDGRAVEVLTHPPQDAAFPVLVMTAFGSQEIVVEVMKAGALDYVVKSLEAFAAIPYTVEHALREWRLLQENKLAEEARLRMRAQLLQAQKLESIGSLASGVAHEINNPIMGIMGYAQLIQDQLGPDSPVAEYAIQIGKEAERVATIVKNLLSFARLDSRSSCPTRLHEIVETTLSLIRAVLRRDQITLEVDVPRGVSEILCHTQQIQQVVMNLLTNARDALNQKYPGHHANKVITISAREVTGDGGQGVATDSPRSRWLRLTVEDQGPGIPEDLRARIFEPFFTTKPCDKGTGLGLSISHGIVKDHGGALSVESEVGQWTRFHVDLPIVESERQVENET